MAPKVKNAALEAELQRLGFERAMAEVRPLLYVALDGRDKSGKDHWSLTAPGPIGIIDVNRGLEGVVQKFQKKKEIHVLKIEAAADQVQAQREFKKFDAAWRSLLLKSGLRTLIVDNFGEVWELARVAEFGSQSSRARNYGGLNAMMDELLNLPLEPANTDTNVILIHNLKDEWVNDESTGNLTRWGYKNTRHKAQINALIEMKGVYTDRLRFVGTDTYKTEDPDKDDNVQFRLTVSNSRFDADMAGKTFEDKDCNFKALASWVHDNVPASHWD